MGRSPPVICKANNTAERAVRGIAVGRRNWTFCGSDSGGKRAAVIYALIVTCKLNGSVITTARVVVSHWCVAGTCAQYSTVVGRS